MIEIVESLYEMEGVSQVYLLKDTNKNDKFMAKHNYTGSKYLTKLFLHLLEGWVYTLIDNNSTIWFKPIFGYHLHCTYTLVNI